MYSMEVIYLLAAVLSRWIRGKYERSSVTFSVAMAVPCWQSELNLGLGLQFQVVGRRAGVPLNPAVGPQTGP
jgi:hypothetical protein